MTDGNDAPKPKTTRSLQSVVEDAFAKALEAHGLNEQAAEVRLATPAAGGGTDATNARAEEIVPVPARLHGRLTARANRLANKRGRPYTLPEDWVDAANAVAGPSVVIDASHLGENWMQLLRRGRAIARANGRERPNEDDKAQARREIMEDRD